MKEIKEYIYHDDNYDVDIRCYLTHAEVEAIANAVMAFKTWAMRRENIDALVLHFCTNISDEEIEKVGIANLTKAGLVEAVEDMVFNFDEIERAIEFKEKQETAQQMARQFLDMEKKLKKNGK